jgi:hypothetical protein
MKIKIPNGMEMIIDRSDFSAVSKLSWHATTLGRRNYTRYIHSDGNGKSILLHRFLMKPENNQIIDHINGNGLDNRRSNLRIATLSQNNMNARKRKDGITSQYKGVTFYKRTKRFFAQITINKKYICLGYFKSAFIAALAYDAEAIKLFGKYARLNFPSLGRIGNE